MLSLVRPVYSLSEKKAVYTGVTKSYSMTTRTKINNATCPVRIVAVAQPYGFKTIGSFYKFLKQCNPAAKLYYGISHVRVTDMLRIVERELNSSVGV